MRRTAPPFLVLLPCIPYSSLHSLAISAPPPYTLAAGTTGSIVCTNHNDIVYDLVTHTYLNAFIHRLHSHGLSYCSCKKLYRLQVGSILYSSVHPATCSINPFPTLFTSVLR